jgi:hypothetical protein
VCVCECVTPLVELGFSNVQSGWSQETQSCHTEPENFCLFRPVFEGREKHPETPFEPCLNWLKPKKLGGYDKTLY